MKIFTLCSQLSLEGWNVDAKMAQFENYVNNHLQYFKDQVIKMMIIIIKNNDCDICDQHLLGPHHVHHGGRLPIPECCHELQKHG